MNGCFLVISRRRTIGTSPGGSGGGGSEALAAAVLADSPVGYWKLDDAAGTTAVDSSGNGHNGTYQGTYSLSQPGNAGDAVSLNAGAVALPALTLSRPFSLEIWLKPTGCTQMGGGSAGFGTIFGLSGSRRLLWHPGGKLLSQIPSSIYSVDNDIPADAWSHIVYTNSSGTSNNEKIYANNSLDAEQTNTSADWLSSFWLGTYAALTGLVDYLIVGLVQHAAVYDQALSPTQVSNHFNAV